ncbi:ABC transporter permease [Candidatus Parcubacteria bacterium]|nr:MAG: ABC transporter permease [Candidatus Parcubacteria bacterium]
MIIIEPPRGWQPINLKELREYRDLFYFLVRRDVQVLYKQTVLGFGWAVLRPLLTMVLFTFVFGNVARISSDGVPYAIFSYTALVPWTYFSTALTTSAMSLVANSNMLSKVYFPRLVFPFSPVVAKLVDFLIAFAFLPVLMLWFGITPTWYALFTPALVAIMMLTAAGIGMWLSALGIQYRDVNHATPFLTQLMLYAAPVVWPVSALTSRFGLVARRLYGLYPMAGVIEGFRAAWLGTVPMPWDLIGLGFLSAVVIFVAGAFYFRRMEVAFADVA